MMRLLFIVAVVFCLTACGWFSDDKGFFVNRSDDYLTVTEGAELQVPADLQTARVADPYPIPDLTTQLNPEFYPGQPPRPDAIYANDNRDEVRIQKLGDRRWLVVPEPPTTVWPKVKQFLAENGVGIATETASQGRIDTQWLNIGARDYRDIIRTMIQEAKQEADVTGGRDRLLIRVESGLRESTSEVHVRYENDSLSTPQDNLVDLNDMQSLVVEAEVEVLTEIGAYIAARVSEQTVSMVAQEMTNGVKSRLTRNAQGDPVLELNLDYDRAWATIGQALSRAEAEVSDSDQPNGIYYVEISEELLTGEKKGWVKGMFSGGGDKQQVQLRLTAMDDTDYEVSVLDDSGEPVDREFAQQVLSMLREFSS